MDDLDKMIYRAPRLPFLFPTQMARARASALQGAVMSDEGKSYSEHEEWEARRAAIHTRQDVVLLVGWQHALHGQLVNISRGIWVLVVVALVALGKLTP